MKARLHKTSTYVKTRVDQNMTLQYTIVSLLATSADFLFFWFWTHHFPTSAATSTLLSMAVGAVVSWTLHRTWVFSDSTVKRAKKMSRYFLGVALSIALNVFFMALLVDILALPEFISRIFSSITVWAIIYTFNRKIVFQL